MKAVDFIYDGIKLSDTGYMICQFGSSGGTTTSTAGSTITFNSVSMYNGQRNELTSAKYSEPFTATFSICKKADSSNELVISAAECASLMHWLNRKDYHSFTLIDKYDQFYNGVHYMGSFNVERITVGGCLIGLQLTFTSDSPYGYGNQVTINENLQSSEDSFSVNVKSDQIGFLYPDEVVITLNGAGNLTIGNQADTKSMYIANCTTGQIITADCIHKVITTSLASHDICSDFNYSFFRFIVDFGGANYITSSVNPGTNNIITSTIPCSIQIKYTPIYKVVF